MKRKLTNRKKNTKLEQIHFTIEKKSTIGNCKLHLSISRVTCVARTRVIFVNLYNRFFVHIQ